jgi:hypothetical protein
MCWELERQHPKKTMAIIGRLDACFIKVNADIGDPFQALL